MSFNPVLIIFLSATLLGAVQQTPNSSSQAASSQAGAASAAENAQIRQLGNTRANDAQALRDDIQKNARPGAPDGNQSGLRRYYAIAVEAPVSARHRHVEYSDRPDGAESVFKFTLTARVAAGYAVWNYREQPSTCVCCTVEVFAQRCRISNASRRRRNNSMELPMSQVDQGSPARRWIAPQN